MNDLLSPCMVRLDLNPATMGADMSDKPIRRWYQFSLRTLFSLVFLSAVSLAFVANPLIRIRKQNSLIAEIRRSQSIHSITFADDPEEKHDIPLPGHWLAREILGDNAFRDIIRIHLGDKNVGESTYRRMGELQALESLSITDGTLSVKEAQYLARIPKLKHLGLECHVSSGALAELAESKSLHDLSITDRSFDDEALKGIGGLTSLEHIVIYGTAVTGKGVAEIGNIDGLRHLDLGLNPGIADGDHRWILKLQALEYLRLEETEIGDRALESISQHQQIKQLELGFTNITGGGVQQLCLIRQLEELDLTCTAVADEAISRIAELPNLEKLTLDQCTLLTDEATVSLAKMKRLKHLRLGSTRFSSRGLGNLSVLTNLEVLSLCSEANKQSVLDLRRSLPKCQIDANGGYLPWDGE